MTICISGDAKGRPNLKLLRYDHRQRPANYALHISPERYGSAQLFLANGRDCGGRRGWARVCELPIRILERTCNNSCTIPSLLVLLHITRLPMLSPHGLQFSLNLMSLF